MPLGKKLTFCKSLKHNRCAEKNYNSKTCVEITVTCFII